MPQDPNRHNVPCIVMWIIAMDPHAMNWMSLVAGTIIVPQEILQTQFMGFSISGSLTIHELDPRFVRVSARPFSLCSAG